MTRRWGARRVVIGVVAWAVLGGLAPLGAQTQGQMQGQMQGRDSLAGSGPGRDAVGSDTRRPAS